jgi:hypothetical protein
VPTALKVGPALVVRLTICAVVDSPCNQVAWRSLFLVRVMNLRQSIAGLGFTVVYIVQAKPREAEGGIKVIKDTRDEALRTAKDFLDQGLPFVTIIGDGRVYTVEEFALAIINSPHLK